MGIHLYTTYYNEKNDFRKEELLACILKNARNPQISSLVVFNEGDLLQPFEPSKIIDVPIAKRPTYNDFIIYINSRTEDNDIHMIANTDIFFDKHIGVLKDLPLDGMCMALSRYDTTEGDKPLLYNHNDSQDVWVFKGNIKEKLEAIYPIGVPRCDNRFMYDLEEAGYKVINPAFSIKAYHMHKGQRAIIYTDEDNKFAIAPPYRYKYPHNFYGLMGVLIHNLTKRNKLGVYRYDIKKVNTWLPIRIIRKFTEGILKIKFPLIGYES